jgi:hypothetical protein
MRKQSDSDLEISLLKVCKLRVVEKEDHIVEPQDFLAWDGGDLRAAMIAVLFNRFVWPEDQRHPTHLFPRGCS